MRKSIGERVVALGSGHGLELVPQETADAVERHKLVDLASIDAVVKLVVECKQIVYVRFSLGPVVDCATGYSVDPDTGLLMPGLSAAALTPEPWWPGSAEAWIARRLRKYRNVITDKLTCCWLLVGDEIGRGPDHEPLIADATPIARVRPHVIEQARWVY